MRFRAYDSLRVFDVVAHRGGFSAAARELNLSKGAVSYHIKQLEAELGFSLFTRSHRKVQLTRRGEQLWQLSRTAFKDMEAGIAELRDDTGNSITVGMSSYFASRWLSPRLMTFITGYPRTALRLQPLIDVIDPGVDNIDIVIRWGNGRWDDAQIEPLFSCPAFPTAGRALYRESRRRGLEKTLTSALLLHDREASMAWQDWHAAAGLAYRPGRDTLVIPDPNVRVQAIIDGQGAALNDALIEHELATRALYRLSDIELDDYGYFLAYAPDSMRNPALRAFRDWIVGESAQFAANR